MDVPMELSRILISELGGEQFIFLKEKDGERNFPIVIGISEAMAIDRRLKGVCFPRPLTHDLLGNVIEAMGGELEKVVVSDLQDHTFIATLHIRREGESVEIDARPSDAIALGVGLQTPIYVAEHVLETVVGETDSREGRIQMLRQRLGVLGEKISEVSGHLGNDEFLGQAPEEVVQELRRQLDEMTTEYDAIEHVLKKLG